jgi:hypothetical protein
MALQDLLLNILDKSRETELRFLADLTDEDRGSQGTYENWSAKDTVAHANYWTDVRAERAIGFVRGRELAPLPHYDRANARAYEQFSSSTWDEVEDLAERAHARMAKAVRVMDEAALAGPSEESEGTKMWESLVSAAYDHKLIHYSEYYQRRGRMKEAGRLWKEWAALVSPLDDAEEWQGRVRYNAACGLAVAGDAEGALVELRIAVAQRPSLKTWSRLDADLDNLHDLREYRDLFAPSYWWEAIEANPGAEALADQFLREHSMLRIAINECPEGEWLEGDTLYRRPAGLALHIVQTIDNYSTRKPGEGADHPLTRIRWQERDSAKLPSQDALLQYLEHAEQRLAGLISSSDLMAKEEMFPWTGSSILSRLLYTLRHSQHHLADLITELERRGYGPAGWE